MDKQETIKFQFLFQQECKVLINIMNNIHMQNKGQVLDSTTSCPSSPESRLGSIKKKLSVQVKQLLSKAKIDNQQTDKNSPPKGKQYTNLQQIKSMMDFKSQEGFHHEYVMGKKLGEGCHSSVYQCLSTKQNKSYAVKVTKQKDLQLFQSIRQTYRILKKLQHQNIIFPKSLFINERMMTCHMVLQYCQWQNLDYYIKRKKYAFQKEEIAEILRQLLKTVGYLHNSGVCHRDLKPDNILYNKQKRKIKIIDFEIARMKKYLKQPLQMMTKTGFLSYRAPEMFQAIYDEKVDIWAIGVILYELLTLKLPFEAQYQDDQINKILHEQPDYSDLDLWQQDILSRLLTKDPEQRITVSEGLSCPFILKNSKVPENLHPKTPLMVKSPSLGKKDFDQGFKNVDFSSKFYDDEVTDLFLGANQINIGVVIQEQF